MTVRLELQNVKEEILEAIKSIVKLSPNTKMKVVELDENGYDKKYVKDILSTSNELDHAIKNAKAKTFKNAKEMFQDIGVKVG
ncbi:hypothetical protein [Campylobacter fetus]|uniref:hypothetical protein n=1 Tax=Campylobacter fetus TaxID=196 RepID=UPI000FCAA5F1|nr:hypothetical protein [Campylobacter fetus]QQF51336.1 hypothetical protein HHI31_00205 [Campylobacter fetus subsp. venerealis]RUT48834.1 hypothetical protein BWK67_09240 [Campylobacter fetus]RUT48863.1 hypothetical protein BWK51_09235 [Campylobacter fetus]